jgi:hypothetical protein
MRRIGVLVVAIGLLLGRETFAATQLITNGGFEAVSGVPWQTSGGLVGVPIVVNPAVAFSGNDYLSMGNAGGVFNEGVFQIITVPTNTLLARFTYFWGGSIGNDPAGADQFAAALVDNRGTTFFGQESSANSGYQQATFDLTNDAGQSIQIGFFLQAPNAGIGVQTFFAVDNVSLVAFTSNDIPVNDDFANAIALTTTTKISALATNILATKEPGEPKHAGNSGGHSVWWKWTAPSNGVVTINTTNSTINTLLAVYTGDSVSNLTQIAANDDNNSRGDGTSLVKTAALAGTEYEIAVDGKNGATGIIQLNLSFVPDTKAPTVSISSPKSGAKLTNSTVVVQGKATDNLAVAQVQYRLENAQGTNDYQPADGTNAWTATVTDLIPGPNTIRVRAIDISDNVSATASGTVTYVVVSPISVTSTGIGTFSPNLDGELLDVGAPYKIAAKPGSGQVFSNWTGTVTSTTAALTFTMQSNMMLTANFVPNPFLPVVGTYEGLFYDTNGPQHQSSGFFNAKLSSSGAFSAKLLLAGKSVSLSGQFSAGGFASNNIVIKGSTPISAQLQLDLQGGGITGILSNGTWTAELFAGLPAGSPVAQAGRYTLLIPGADDGVAQPGGDSYGTVTVSATGGITFAGVLADGTKVSQKVNLLANGQWPFYIPLYSGNGSIFGWLTFSNAADSDITGPVDWFKLSPTKTKIYHAGFTNLMEAATGSSYAFTSGAAVLNLPAGQLWLANGNLTDSFTNQIALDSANQVTSTNGTLKMSLTTSSGLFKGSVANPTTGKSISFNGIVLQKQNFGGGFFLGTNQAGRVFFGP